MATKPMKQGGKEDAAAVVLGLIPSTVQRLEKILGGAGNSMLSFAPLKEKTLISLQGAGTIAEAIVPIKLEGLEGSWDFALASFTAAVQKRNTAKFSFAGGQLDIVDKRYSTSLQGVETTKPARVEKPNDQAVVVEVTPELWAALEEMTGKVKINKSLAAMPDITVHYHFTKKMGLAVAFDRFQMAAYAIPNTFGQVFSITLPLPKAEGMFKNNGGVTLLAASEAAVYVKSGNVSCSSSLPSAEDTTGVPTDLVVERVKAMQSAKFPKNVVMPTEELKRFLANARAISNANALLRFEVGESVTKLTLSAEGNKVAASIPSKSKKKFNFRLDIGYVQSIVAKASDDVHLEIDDSAVVFRSDELIYAGVLSVDDESESKSSKKSSDEDDEV